MYGNACTKINLTPAESLGADCTTFASGVLTDGLEHTMTAVQRELRGMINNRLAAHVDTISSGQYIGSGKPYVAGMESWLGPFSQAFTIDLFVTTGLEDAAGLLHDTAQSAIRCWLVINVVMVVAFVALQILFQIFVYHPVVTRLNDSVYSSRALLGLLPDDLVAYMPRLQKELSNSLVGEAGRSRSGMCWMWRSLQYHFLHEKRYARAAQSRRSRRRLSQS